MSFAKSKFAPNDARTTVINITSYENKNPVGTIANSYFGEEFVFRSFIELILSIDRMLDELELPKASTHIRSFTAVQDIQPLRAKKTQESLAVFKLKVLFRQNASWQGNVTWVEGNSEAPFRSVFELAYLMDSALSGIPNSS